MEWEIESWKNNIIILTLFTNEHQIKSHCRQQLLQSQLVSVGGFSHISRHFYPQCREQCRERQDRKTIRPAQCQASQPSSMSWRRGHKAPPLSTAAVDRCTVRYGESFFFRDVSPDRLPMLSWVASPHAHIGLSILSRLYKKGNRKVGERLCWREGCRGDGGWD